MERFQVLMHVGGIIEQRPLSPSKQISRPSAKVAAKTPTRDFGCSQPNDLTVSAAVRVFPKPRPARSSQIRHAPAGSSWLNLAVESHLSYVAAISCSLCSSSFRSFSSFRANASISDVIILTFLVLGPILLSVVVTVTIFWP